VSAYVILDVEVTDAAAYEAYKTHSTRVLAPYGGASRGNMILVEGVR
jgi:uncharacterized protein (DUF1330 family)